MLSYCGFFLSKLQQLVRSYTGLFTDEDGETDNGTDGGGYSKHWGWFIVLDKMSNGRREQWDWITEMNIVQFLTYMSFLKDKNEFENEVIKKSQN